MSLGLRALLVVILLLGVLLGFAARSYHRAIDRARLLAELRSRGVGTGRLEPTPLGRLASILPSRATNRLYASYGDRYQDLVAAPTSFSVVAIRRGELETILPRLGRLGRVRSLTVPGGLSRAELDSIRNALPDTEVIIDSRFEYGRFWIDVHVPGGPT